MNKDRVCEMIVSYCGQCPHHYYYNDEEWICKKTFEHLENLEEFGKECPLKEIGGMRVKTIEDKNTKLYHNEEINEVQGCIDMSNDIMGERRKTKTIKCLNCGKEFRVKKNINNKKFCSKECKLNYNTKTKIVKCANCGKEFKVNINNNRKRFCGKKCKRIYDNYVHRIHNTKYMKKLKDKINYNPSTTYMTWQDERYNKNIGTKQIQRVYDNTNIDKYKDESKCDKKDKECIKCEDKICYDMDKYLKDYKKQRINII